jgi:hypothetical protein
MGGARAWREEPADPPGQPYRDSRGFEARLRNAAARALSPTGYLALFGGMQLGLVLLLHRFWPFWMTPGIAIVVGLLVALVLVRGRWGAKWAALVVAIAVLTAGPTVVLMHGRAVRGITSIEHDGAIQAEVAMQRILQGQPIYGVDWSHTALAEVPWNYNIAPANPALHHNVYFPLVPLAGIPFYAVARAVGFPFDYRQVLLACLVLGVVAVWLLPIHPSRRFAIAAALFLSPLLGLYFWAGRNEMPVVALVFLGLALLARRHPVLGCLVLGTALAYKLFAAPAIPFALAVIWLRWREHRQRGEVVASLLALAVVPLCTVIPFLLSNPSAFIQDVVLYPSRGGPESYPIAGLGFGRLLLAAHLIHKTDVFPFWIFQLAAVSLGLWLTLPWFLRWPSLGRFMVGLVAVLIGMSFFARYFNDSHAALVLSLVACCVPLGEAPLLARPVDGGRVEPPRGSWLAVGTWR